jgi:hypothetical protein
MKRFSFTVAAATTSGAAAVALAGIAAAAPTGGGNAGDATKELHAAGHNVQINGSLTDPLSTCVTTGVHGTPTTAGLPGPSFGSRLFTTIYLDVLCPDAH